VEEGEKGKRKVFSPFVGGVPPPPPPSLLCKQRGGGPIPLFSLPHPLPPPATLRHGRSRKKAKKKKKNCFFPFFFFFPDKLLNSYALEGVERGRKRRGQSSSTFLPFPSLSTRETGRGGGEKKEGGKKGKIGFYSLSSRSAGAWRFGGTGKQEKKRSALSLCLGHAARVGRGRGGREREKKKKKGFSSSPIHSLQSLT